jgi:hypothetical protein
VLRGQLQQIAWTRSTKRLPTGSAANLSDAQRKQAVRAYINSHFKPDEHVRVEALLHL